MFTFTCFGDLPVLPIAWNPKLYSIQFVMVLIRWNTSIICMPCMEACVSRMTGIQICHVCVFLDVE